MTTKSIHLLFTFIITLLTTYAQAKDSLPKAKIESSYQTVDLSMLDINEDQLSCDTPSAQPQAVQIDSISTSFVLGHFVAAADATGYLVIIGDSIMPGFVPVRGTSYTVGTSISNCKVMKAGAGTTFSTGGLTANKYYYVYIYSMKTGCAGGPVYRTISPAGTVVHTTISDRSNQMNPRIR